VTVVSENLKSLLKKVNEVAKDIVDAIHRTDTKIAELQERRQKIGDALVSREEFIEYIARQIDRKSGNFGFHVRNMVGGIDASFFSVERNNLNISGSLLTGGRNVPVDITEEAIYWYLKPAIMARMSELADQMDFPIDAIPADERRKMISEIDAEIQILRVERNDMAQQLKKAGITG
jgi:hypothetical protein